MLIRPITYKDFDDKTVTETFHFHLSEGDLTRFNLVHGADLEERLAELVEKKDAQAVLDLFDDLIKRAVGRKEGKHFKKSEEITADLMFTGAYDSLFNELVTDSDAAAAFVRGIMPKGVVEKAGLADKAGLEKAVATVELPAAAEVVEVSDQIVTAESSVQPASEEDTRPLYQRENRKATQREIQDMERPAMLEAFAWAEKLGE